MLRENNNLDYLSKQRVLCLLIKKGEILLAEKKEGLGQGKWTGIGGKIEEGETLEEAVSRETLEEIGVTLISFRKVAVLNFLFPYKADWSQRVIVFLAEGWEGEPRESEEMRPHWFNIDSLPWSSMWDDYSYWLPRILKGECLEAVINYGPDSQKVSSSKIHILT